MKHEIGNRIATAMFYLSDLNGGATAFPKIGIAAKPKAGSMVFWYNLKKSGLVVLFPKMLILKNI